MVKMHPPKPTLSNVCTSQRENASTEKEGWENKGKEGAQAGGSYEVQHAVGYIPCLATISIGQDRKYTIEGSSATDKDYPIKTKNGKKNKLINVYLIRSTGQSWRVKIRMRENELKCQCQCQCVLFWVKSVVWGGKQWCIFVFCIESSKHTLFLT